MSITKDFNLHKEEYLALRKEIEIILQEFSTLRQYCLVGAAIAFTWTSTHKFSVHAIAWISWLIPFLIAVFGALLAWAKHNHINTIGKYIKNIEDDYLKEARKAPNVPETPLPGWRIT